MSLHIYIWETPSNLSPRNRELKFSGMAEIKAKQLSKTIPEKKTKILTI